jgi:general secretion pathway protein C
MLFETILNRAVEPVKWLFIVGIAYTLAMTVWSFFETPVRSSVATPQADSKTLNGRAPGNVNWIMAKHLFGEAGAVPEQRDSGNDEPLVETRLPLELQSVFVADDLEESAAIVAQKGKPGKLYAVGDNLPGNAKLVDVLTDRIILRRAGARETLMFFKLNDSQFIATDDPEQTADRPAQSSNVTPPADGRTALSRQGPAKTNVQGTESTDAPGQQEILKSYREKLASDATGTLDELGIESVDAGNSGGYRIGSASQNPYLRNTGLQAGDVILSVNGRPVGDIQQDQLELENIMAQGSARIEVQRGSRRFFITASLNEPTLINAEK